MNKYIVIDAEGNIVSCGKSESGLDQRACEDHAQVWVDFPDDIENYRFINAEFVTIPNSEINEKRLEEANNLFRGLRDQLLQKSDWTQSNDSPLTDAKKTEWATYRQALRDLPANTNDPSNPVWPIQPS